MGWAVWDWESIYEKRVSGVSFNETNKTAMPRTPPSPRKLFPNLVKVIFLLQLVCLVGRTIQGYLAHEKTPTLLGHPCRGTSLIENGSGKKQAFLERKVS